MASIAAVFVVAASPVSAAYVIDTGTPSDYSGVNIDSGQRVAGRFTLAADTLITSAEGVIAGNGGGTGRITIYGDGPTPGLELYSAKFGPVSAPGQGMWQGVFKRSWLLTAGTYWIGFSTNRYNYLIRGAPSPLDLEAYDNGDGWMPFNVGIGVRLSDSVPAIPEPASWALMLAGFAVAGIRLRRRRATMA